MPLNKITEYRIIMRFVKVISAVVLPLVIVLLYLQLDDPVTEDAADMMVPYPADRISYAYYTLMGMAAEEGEDATIVGENITHQIREIEESYLESPSAGPINYDALDLGKQIPLPTGEIFCNSRESSCLPSLFSAQHEKAIPPLIIQYQFLLDRYRHFLQAQDYLTLTMPGLHEPLPEYRLLQAGHRLSLSANLVTSKNDPELALDNALKELRALRNQLSKQDSTIGKMVLLNLVSESIDVIFWIARVNKLKFAQSMSIFSAEERNLEGAFKREFTSMVHLFKSMDGAKNFFHESGDVPAWVVRAIFKPNISSNALAPFYQALVKLSQMPLEDFLVHYKSVESITVEGHPFRNYFGTRLNKIAHPYFTKYIARLHAIDGKIALFNELVNRSSLEQSFDVPSPYHENKKAVFDQDEQRICFDGPIEIQPRYGCLVLPIDPALSKVQ